MIKSLFYTGLLLVGVIVNLSAQGIKFEHGSWDEVKAKAAESNKPIFVDAYTTWCGPCKWMAANVFVDEKVGAYMNDKFISVKIDMEKGEGVDFAKTYKVMAYPTLLFFSSAGELLHKGVGGRDGDGLIALCKEAMDPAKQIATFHKKYNDGNRDKKFLQSYVSAILGAYEDASGPFQEYWNLLSKEEKNSEEGLQMLAQVTQNFADFEDEYFKYFMENKAAYKKSAGEEMVNSLVSRAYKVAVWRVSRVENVADREVFSNKLQTIFPEYNHELKLHLDFMIADAADPRNEKKYAKAKAKYLKVTTDAEMLNSFAWQAYEQEDSRKKLKEAIKWVNRSVELQPNFFNLDTQAALYFKTNQLTKAKVSAEAAIKAAEDGMDTSATEDLLEQINKGLSK